jgi:hypothetical protein
MNQELKAEGEVVLDVGRLVPDSMHPATPLTCELCYNGFRWRLGVEWRGRQERKEDTCSLTGVGYGAGVEGSRKQHWSDGKAGTGGLVFLDGLVFEVECLGLAGDTGGAEPIRPMEMRWVWEALVDRGAIATDDAVWGGAGQKNEVMTTGAEEVDSFSSSSFSTLSSSNSFWFDSLDSYDDDWLPPSGDDGSSASSDSAGSGEAAGSSEGDIGSESVGLNDDYGPWDLCGLQRRKGYFPGHVCFDWGVYRSRDWSYCLLKTPDGEDEEALIIRRWSFDRSFSKKGVMVEELVGNDEQLRALARHGGVWLRCYLYCR